MKRIAVVLTSVIAFAASFAGLQTIEAGGGGSHFPCMQDTKVTDTYDGPALEVTVRDSCFGPGIARIAPGTELRWVNRGQQPHNIVDVAQQKPTREIRSGDAITMSFAQAGAFVYYCAYHPGMTGAVFVGDSLADAAPETVYRPLPSPAVVPPAATAQVPAREANGVSTFMAVLLALAVGTIAGGGSTLLVRLLDRPNKTPSM